MPGTTADNETVTEVRTRSVRRTVTLREARRDGAGRVRPPDDPSDRDASGASGVRVGQVDVVMARVGHILSLPIRSPPLEPAVRTGPRP